MSISQYRVRNLKVLYLKSSSARIALSALVNLPQSHMHVPQHIAGLRWLIMDVSSRFKRVARATWTFWESKTSLVWQKKDRSNATSRGHSLIRKFSKSQLVKASRAFRESCRLFLSTISL